MVKFTIGSVAALTLLITPASAQSIIGTWKTPMTEEGQLLVSVKDCGSNVCGTIVGARDTQGVAGSYTHVGRKMIWDMTAKGSNSWDSGKIWDPRNDRTFNSKMELRGNILKVSGCFLGLCQTQNWQRAK